MEKLYSCRNCVLGLFFVLFVIFSADAASSSVTYKGENIVVEGNPFEITCRLSVFYPVKWLHDKITLYPDENIKVTLEEDKTESNYVISKLSIALARDYHSGEYRCSSFVDSGHTVVVLGAGSIVGNFDFDNYKVIDFKTTRVLVLQCNFTVDGPSSDGVVLKWLKNEKPLSLEDARIETKAGENKLSIQKPVETDAGNYSCVVSNKKTNSTDLRLDFNVIYKPYVKLPPHSSVVEGEKLILHCIVMGDPVPSIYWKVGNKTYEESEGRVKLLDSKDKDRPIPKSTLQIDEATMDDRNTYTCVASNIANKNGTETVTFVRVKDKLAALWPFLGICAEVIVLCTIILIYEKKRNKTELDESDTDGSPEQKNTPDHGKDSEVRHRK